MSILFVYRVLQCCFLKCSSKRHIINSSLNLKFTIDFIIFCISLFFPLHLSLRSECYQSAICWFKKVDTLLVHCCTQVLLKKRSAFDNSHNLFTMCCLQVLVVGMQISSNSLGHPVIVVWQFKETNELLKCCFRFWIWVTASANCKHLSLP